MSFNDKKNIIPSLMTLMFALFLFALPIFGGQTRVNNLLHLSLLLFIATIVIYRHKIYEELITNKNDYKLYKNGILAIFVFLVYFSISNLWSEDALSVSSEITHSLYIICFIIIFKIAVSRLGRTRVYSILAAAIVALCILTLIFADKNHIFVSRLKRSFPWAPSNVIDLGGYFSIGILLLLMIIRDTGKKLLYFPALLLFFGLLLTQSRNPLFSLIITSLPLLLLVKKSNLQRIKKTIYALICVAIVIAFINYDQGLFSRFSKSYHDIFVRVGIWQDAFNLFLQKPVFGWGFSKALNFTNSIGQHITTTHSLYFAVLLKGGIVGMMTFLLMIGCSLIIAFNAFRKGYELEFCLFCFSLLFYATQGMFIIENPGITWILFWLPLAIIYSTVDQKGISARN